MRRGFRLTLTALSIACLAGLMSWPGKASADTDLSFAQRGVFQCFPCTREVISLCDLGAETLVGTSGGLAILPADGGSRRLLLPCIPVGDLCALPEAPDQALVACDHGLLRYEAGALTPLSEEPCTAVLALPDGETWTGHPAGVVRHWQSGGVVESFTLPTRAAVHDIEARGDDVFAAAIDGLWRIRESAVQQQTLSRDPLSQTVLPLVTSGDALYVGTAEGLFRWADGEWASVPAEDGLQHFILSVGPGDPARGWEATAGTDADGLFAVANGRLCRVWDARVPRETGARRAVQGAMPQLGDGLLGISAICGTGTLLLGSSAEGLWQWREGSPAVRIMPSRRDPGEPVGNDISSLAFAAHTRTLFAGSSIGGLSAFRNGRWSHETVETGLPDDWINQLATDGRRVYMRTSNGNVYTTAEGGSWRQVGKRPDGWPKDWTSALGNDGSQLWAATYSAFYLRDPRGWQVFIPKPALQGQFVLSVALRGDEAWLATQKGGLYCWNRKADTCRRFSQGSGLSDTWVTAVTTFGGDIWAGTFAGGLCRLPQGADPSADPAAQWRTYRAGEVPATIPSDRINCLLATETCLCVGTLSGLSVTDGVSWRTFGLEDGLPSDTVRCLAADGEYLWVGTDGGLCRAKLADLRSSS